MVATRRAQQQRALTTRARLIEAAFDGLLEDGYAATTVGAVQARAGVARGTLLHHFPTRGDLMAGVVEDLVERRLEVLGTSLPAGPEVASWDEVVDLVWRALRSPAYTAALELWVAARTDPELRDALLPLQQRIFAAVHRSITLLVGEDHPQAPMLVQFTIDLLTGSHLAGVLEPRLGTDRVVEAWKVALRTLADAWDTDA
ncbi:TetR/AcrR family transcriptional regulator [Aeromicrobium sp. Leaf350]|uniref:TetR/AcrR family transcriptional regulator n=1 Tax=Aeromicrobium sp. Leaf350 TaxID=2876565 RepID=UPI001E5AD5ED|nr:TetR/AcrR family transcriptional regulator [Aeromicrobium sp. Leaf350]